MRKILFCSLFIFSLSLLPAMGAKDMIIGEQEEEPTIQEIYDEMDTDSLPSIGFLTPEVGGGIPYQWGKVVQEELLTQLISQGEYIPYSLNEWYRETYSQRAPADIVELLQIIRNKKFPLDYLCTIKITQFTDRSLMVLGLYNPQDISDVKYVFRMMDNIEKEWDDALSEMITELYVRIESEPDFILDKLVYLDSMKVRFYQYYALQTGEYTFTEIPFMTMDEVDYRQTDDVFSQWLGLRLHMAGIFPVILDDIETWVDDDIRRMPGCNWGIRGELRISEKFSLLRLSLYDYQRKMVVTQVDLPFSGMSSQEVSELVDSAIPYIISTILSDTEKKGVAFVKPEYEPLGDTLYTEKGYQGPSDIINSFLVPAGMSHFLFTDKKKGLPEDNHAFNFTLMSDPSGTIYRIFLEKEILYAEQLFKD